MKGVISLAQYIIGATLAPSDYLRLLNTQGGYFGSQGTSGRQHPAPTHAGSLLITTLLIAFLIIFTSCPGNVAFWGKCDSF